MVDIFTEKARATPTSRASHSQNQDRQHNRIRIRLPYHNKRPAVL
jgi:hypothetical protein